DRIAAWIQKKHGCLLARLALEADVRLDDELDACCNQLVCKFLPRRHWQDQTKMSNRNVVTIHHIRVPMSGVRRKMRNDLVSVEIKIDPFRRRTAFRATQQPAVERTRLVQAGD